MKTTSLLLALTIATVGCSRPLPPPKFLDGQRVCLTSTKAQVTVLAHGSSAYGHRYRVATAHALVLNVHEDDLEVCRG
ncbi:MAG: hypothetical protein ACR2PH_17905 [Desulfobulbia bacterium]